MVGLRVQAVGLVGLLVFLEVGVLPAPVRKRMSLTAEQGSALILASASGPVSLGNGPRRSVLVPRGECGKARKSSKCELETLSSNHRVYLILRELRVAAPPGILYHVYFDLAKDAKPETEDMHFVGNLNFFNEAPAAGEKVSPTAAGSFRSYEITELVKKLAARKLLAEESSVTIIPSGAPASEAHATIDSIELVLQ